MINALSALTPVKMLKMYHVSSVLKMADFKGSIGPIVYSLLLIFKGCEAVEISMLRFLTT